MAQHWYFSFQLHPNINFCYQLNHKSLIGYSDKYIAYPTIDSTPAQSYIKTKEYQTWRHPYKSPPLKSSQFQAPKS
jgi:hypothetical protein